MIARSLLFVPADRPERIDKALASGADAVIIDLEDAVAPAAKEAAREALSAWLRGREVGGAKRGPPIVVRVNGADSPWFAADLAVCAAPAIRAVMVPKAGQLDDMDAVRRALPDTATIALIETAEGFDRMRTIARGPGVARLAFGNIDFQLDLGMADDGEALAPYRARFVIESRLANLPAPIDGVTTSLHDQAVITRDAQAARRIGFGAKLCIHPQQVAAVNQSFTPTAAEVDWARRVVDAAQAAAGAAVAVDGKMVDRPVLLRAQSLLRQAGAS